MTSIFLALLLALLLGPALSFNTGLMALMIFVVGVPLGARPAIPDQAEQSKVSQSEAATEAQEYPASFSLTHINTAQEINTMSAALNTETIHTALSSLPGWTYEDNALVKEFTFSNFREAISFIMRMSFYAEELNHHPELFNVYNTVRLKLTTHDAGNQVTQKDLDLARAIEGFNWRK